MKNLNGPSSRKVRKARAEICVILRERGFTFKEINTVIGAQRGPEFFRIGARLENRRRKQHGLPPKYPEFVYPWDAA